MTVDRTSSRTKLVALATCAIVVRVFLACGSPGLDESDSCAKRKGTCADVEPSGAADCNPPNVIYLDSCYCCAPAFDAGASGLTFGGGGTGGDDDSGSAGDDASMSGDADMGGDAAQDGEADGASDGGTSALDAADGSG